jgi:heme/copper-type cytochrome/quinol oxidase subunit 2
VRASATYPSLPRNWLPGAVLALAALAVVFLPAWLRPTTPVDRTLRLEARSFEFSPSVLTVNRGDRVTLEVVALDVVHGAHIDGYGLEVTADPGQTARLTFVADRAGAFTIRCIVPCGPLHPFMIGRLRVDPSDTLVRAMALAILAVLVGALLSLRHPPAAAPSGREAGA